MAELFNLKTLVERDTFTVDGTSYELRNPVELGLSEYAEFIDHQAALQGDLSEAERKRRLSAIVAIVVPTMAPRVRAKLQEMQVALILGAFSSSLQEMEGGDLGNAWSAQTSGASSPASNASTKAPTRPRGSGSRKR